MNSPGPESSGGRVNTSPLSRPAGFESARGPKGLRIRWGAGAPGAITVAAVFCFVLMGVFLLITSGHDPAKDGELGGLVVVPVIMGLAGSILLYRSMVAWFGHVELCIDDRHVSVLFRPLPMPQSKRVAIAELRDVGVEHVVHPAQRNTETHIHRVVGTLRDGSKVRLVDDLSTSLESRWLCQQISEQLTARS